MINLLDNDVGRNTCSRVYLSSAIFALMDIYPTSPIAGLTQFPSGVTFNPIQS